jgi:hypothetical protein
MLELKRRSVLVKGGENYGLLDHKLFECSLVTVKVYDIVNFYM